MEGVIHCAKCDVDLVDELPPLPEGEKKPTILGALIGDEEADDLRNISQKSKNAARTLLNSNLIKKASGNFWVFLVVLLTACQLFSRLVSLIIRHLIPWDTILNQMSSERLFDLSETYFGLLQLSFLSSLKMLLIEIIANTPFNILFFMGLLYYAYQKDPRTYLIKRNILINIAIVICHFFLFQFGYSVINYLSMRFDFNLAMIYIIMVPLNALSIFKVLIIYILTVEKSQKKKLIFGENALKLYVLLVFIWFVSYFFSYFLQNSFRTLEYSNTINNIYYSVLVPISSLILSFTICGYLFLHSKNIAKERTC